MLSAESFARPRPGLVFAAGLLLFLAVVGIFLPATGNGFIDLDDQNYVTVNSHVQSGLTLPGVAWAFRDGHTANWHPLTWLSHMLDCQLFGLRPAGHHLTSILLHGLNSWLLFLLLRRMTGAMLRSLFVAAVFGLHPLHVESVAWVAERKDVLSTFFGLLTLWAYLRWVEESGKRESKPWGFYGAALFCFALSLMSKSMLVTLPFVLLLLDYWPLNRFKTRLDLGSGRILLRLIGEKVPFFAVAVAASIITVVFQRHGGAVQSLSLVPFSFRVENALISYCRYLAKLFWPVDLAVFYPSHYWPTVDVLMAVILLLSLSLLVAVRWRRSPYLLVGWCWFLGTLVPVIGLVQVGAQAMADRYTYFPSIGLFLGVVWAACEWMAPWRYRTPALASSALVTLVGCTVLTGQQIGYWVNTEVLYRHTLAVTDDNSAIHIGLGIYLGRIPGRLSEAMAEYHAGLEIKPDDADAHCNLGAVFAKLPGRLPDAIAEYEAALQTKPDYAEAHNGLGTALARTPGRMSEAILEYEAAVKLQPDYSAAHDNLGIALSTIPGRLPDAIAEYQTALKFKPDNLDAHFNLGNALGRLPHRQLEAIAEFEAVLKIKPDDVEAQYNLGAVLLQLPGRLPEATAHFRAALKINPHFEPARQVLEQLGAAP